MDKPSQCKKCLEKAESFQTSLKKVIEDIAGGVSEEELIDIAPTLAKHIVPEQFLQSVAKELRSCLHEGLENAWNEYNINYKVHQLDELQENAEEQTTVPSLSEIDPFRVKKYFLLQRKKTLTERTDKVKTDTDELCRRIREKRELMQEQMEQIEAAKKAMEKNVLETNDKLST